MNSPNLPLADIERALDGVLRTILDRRCPASDAPAFRVLTMKEIMAGPVLTREESAIKALADDPVGAAARQAVRRCGEELFRRGGFDLMSSTLDKVADMDPDRWASRANLMDKNWDAIGNAWWS